MPNTKPTLLKPQSLNKILKHIPKLWRQDTIPIDSMTSCTTSLLTSLKQFVSQRDLSGAFKAFSFIKPQLRLNPDLIAIALSSLFSCCNCSSNEFVLESKQLHGHVIVLGLEKDPFLVPKVVGFYTNFGILSDARFVVENSRVLNPLGWNLVISWCVRNGKFGDAIDVYKKMVDNGVMPDNFTYPSVLKACGEVGDLAFGKKVHGLVVENVGINGWSLVVHNSLVHMYGKVGEVDVARRLFDGMLKRDDVSWNTIIACYASRGMWDEAFKLFDRMRGEELEVNIITWNTIAGGCLRTGRFAEALGLLSKVRNCGLAMDPVAMIIGLGACSHIDAIKLGKEIHGSAIICGNSEYDNVRNALITMYSRCKDLRHAHMIFRSIELKSIVTWNSMLSGLTLMNQAEEAAFIFREMLFSGIKPNYVTIASILPLCARVANLQHGKEFHCYISRHSQFKDYLLLWNALVDMYSRSGKVSLARRLFDSMDQRDEVTYTSLIAGYGIQGDGKAAMRLFDEMLNYHIKPDNVTMIAVLSACSHSGMVKEGKMQFQKMYSEYGLEPDLQHFSCMVDLYGRAGLVHKAKEVIMSMPYQPTSAMWATLLGACRIHGYMGVGEWAAGKLLEMKPEHPGYYVLIANMYAAASCWDKLAKVRTFMRDLGVRKDPGCAWVDVGSRFLPFVVGDSAKPQSNELHSLLGGLSELMKDVGDIAREDFSSSDDDLLAEMGGS